jgi:hypothetical protein
VLQIFQEPSNLVLTGVIITVASSLVYKITPTGFKFWGKYRTKEQAVLIYLVIVVILGLSTPLISEIIRFSAPYIPLISVVGVLIIASNFIIHESVHSWSHTTIQSLLIYLSGVALTIFGGIVGF